MMTNMRIESRSRMRENIAQREVLVDGHESR